jgi:dTDP-4-dehydrorhamnose reductase
MKWLVTGADGFIGSHLCPYLAVDNEVIGTYWPRPSKQTTFSSCVVNICDHQDIIAVWKKIKPDCVVHLAGSKDVQWCEREAVKARELNTVSCGHIAEACRAINAHLIFLSSDHVFDGCIGQYKTDSSCNPKTVYGTTKMEAEDILQKSKISFSIVRTAGVFAKNNPHDSLLGFAMQHLQSGKEILAYSNVLNSPTYIVDIIRAIKIIGERKLSGVFHAGGASRESRYTFLKLFAQEFGFPAEFVKPSFYKQSLGFERLLDFSLDSQETYMRLGFVFATATQGLRESKGIIRRYK